SLLAGVVHDLLVEGAVQIGFRDEPGPQSVRRETFALRHFDAGELGPGFQDPSEAVRLKTPFLTTGAVHGDEDRAVFDAGALEPGSHRLDRTGIGMRPPGDSDIRPLPVLIDFRGA